MSSTSLSNILVYVSHWEHLIWVFILNILFVRPHHYATFQPASPCYQSDNPYFFIGRPPNQWNFYDNNYYPPDPWGPRQGRGRGSHLTQNQSPYYRGRSPPPSQYFLEQCIDFPRSYGVKPNDILPTPLNAASCCTSNCPAFARLSHV